MHDRIPVSFFHGHRLALMFIAAGLVAASVYADATPRMAEQAPSKPSATGQPVAPPVRTNVVWIVIDALRAQNLSSYGYDRQTSPNMDRLAREGVLFEHHYAQAFWTYPSLPSYMSGRYFAAFCLDLGNSTDLGRVPAPDERLLPEIMSENGYRTCLARHHHAMFTPFCRFCAAFDQTSESEPGQLGEAIEGFLEKHAAAPFFLYVHLMNVHDRSRLAPPFNKWMDDTHVNRALVDQPCSITPPEPFTEEDRRYLVGLYDGSILSGDAAVGQILDVLRGRNLLDNTVVIVGADHGEMLGKDGKSLGHQIISEEVQHVPLIMRGPGIPQGVRIHQMTENVDIVPTLVSLLRLRTAATFDGFDLTRIWQDEAGRPPLRDFVLANSYSTSRNELVLRDFRLTYIDDPVSGAGILLGYPFHVITQNNLCTEYPDVAAFMKQRVDELLRPKWEAYMNRPESTPEKPLLIDIYGGNILPQEALVNRPADTFAAHAALPRDQWLSINGSDKVFGNELMGQGGAALPPLRIHCDVPNAVYHIMMPVELDTTLHFQPILFQMKAQGDADFKKVTVNGKTGLADLGEYEVKNRVFDMTLCPVSNEHAFHMGRLFFIPVKVNVTEQLLKEVSQTREELQALGYLN